MDETIIADLRFWNAIGVIIPVVTMATAARIEKVPGGAVLIETGDAAQIMDPIWRKVRNSSLIVSIIWCLIFSYGAVAIGIFAAAFLASWLPGLLGWYGFIVLRARVLDILAAVAAAIVWVGTLFAATT